MTPLGLIGLGLLGSAVAERLLQAGYSLTAFDLDASRRDAASALGVDAAADAREVAARCEVVITCLPDGLAVSHLLFEAEVADALGPHSVLIDLTTCAPAESRIHAERLAERGVGALDAPVSGSSAAVRRGEGLMMVGGPESLFRRCEPVLQAIAPRVYHVGPAGAGSTAKLVSNLVLGLNRLALAEGLALAERCGLPPDTTLQLLRESAAYSRALDAKGERMLRREYQPNARLRQHLKDVDLILQLGCETGLELPVSTLHRALLAHAVTLGYADADNAAIIEALRNRPNEGEIGRE